MLAGVDSVSEATISALARIERLLVQQQLNQQHQQIAIAHLRDELASTRTDLGTVIDDLRQALQTTHEEIAALQQEVVSANRAAAWYQAQSSQLLRLIATVCRELRAVVIYAASSDRPIPHTVIQALLTLSTLESSAEAIVQAGEILDDRDAAAQGSRTFSSAA